MEELPVELVEQIVDLGSPKSLISLSRTSSGFRNILAGPRLSLPRDYVLPWNDFASSDFSSIKGEGSLQIPTDDRMTRASRRVRGNFQLDIPKEDLWPQDIIRCAHVRILLYPQERFRVRVTPKDPDEVKQIDWKEGSLTIGFREKQWNFPFHDLVRLVSSIPLKRLFLYDPKDTSGGRWDPDRLAWTLNSLSPYLTTLETLVFRERYYPSSLPPSVWRLEIHNSEMRHEIGNSASYSQIQELVLRNPRLNEKSPEDFTHLIRYLSGLQRVIFQLILPEDSRYQYPLGKEKEEIAIIVSGYPNLQFFVEEIAEVDLYEI